MDLNGHEVTKNELIEDYKPFDFSNVKIEDSSQLVQTPRSFHGSLKEYQLKGLRWLDNLYEQGINGILADEMGLGKTIQAIALLSHISEKKGNWGPFLVVAPSSTLHNWIAEVEKFSPNLKVLPYWGGVKERKVLRRYFSQVHLGRADSQFHVCVTSYHIAVADEKSFCRLRWQHVILDEAQQIKNINSQRWKTLMSFRSRNKLLLTGTPLQNNMAELWALLHFIMPKLFDSHEQFQEWFSKDIEASSSNQDSLNQAQLGRLHAILKPFMLRRVKKDVEKEIGRKIEVQVRCELTKRQKDLYASLRNKISLSDFFQMLESKSKVKNLMNLVMQFRKVCNHPELFERRQKRSSYIFTARPPLVKNVQPVYGVLKVFSANMVNPIRFEIPQLVFREIIEPILFSRNLPTIHKKHRLAKLMGIPQKEYYGHFTKDLLLCYLVALHASKTFGRKNYMEHIRRLMDPSDRSQTKKVNIRISGCFNYYGFKETTFAGSDFLVPKSVTKLRQNMSFDVSKFKLVFAQVVAPQIDFQCSDANFEKLKHKVLYSPSAFFTLFGFNRSFPYHAHLTRPTIMSKEAKKLGSHHWPGLLHKLDPEFQSTIFIPSFESLIADSAKLRYLDTLLAELKVGGHRVLIFCQMTKMMNLLEEFMAWRGITFFRLDGNTSIGDRNQMVKEFQSNPKIFAFILSTRAGGLGITLTAADTVIFYDNDWNPTMDAQATDRAHRIGQMNDVRVYRLVSKNTVEEKIVKRAQQKQNVQQTVYSGEAFKADVFKPREVMDLLFDEEEIDQKQASKFIGGAGGGKEAKKNKISKMMVIPEKVKKDEFEDEEEREEEKQDEMEIEFNMSEENDEEN